MNSLGSILKQAREAKGMTHSQIADQTHILVQTVREIEEENFKHIPAAIYGRGFISRIAQTLGLDPAPLVNEFMAIYTGKQPPAVATIPSAPIQQENAAALETSTSTQSDEPQATEPLESKGAADAAEIEEPTLFDEPPKVTMPPSSPAPKAAEPVYKPRPPRVHEESLFTAPYTHEEDRSAESRFKKSLSSVSHGVLSDVEETGSMRSGRIYRKRIIRFGIIAVVALGILALMVKGCNALYSATKQNAADTKVAIQKNNAAAAVEKSGLVKPVQTNQGTAPSSKGKIHSTGQTVPALYID